MSSQKTAKKYAIYSFVLAIIELVIAILVSLEIASNACQRPTIIDTYNQIFIGFICHPLLALLTKPLYYAPIFTLWLIIVIPISSLILAALSVLSCKDRKWKILSALGVAIHFILLVGIILEMKYKVLFLLP